MRDINPIVLTYVRIPLLNLPMLCVKPWLGQKLVTMSLVTILLFSNWNPWWQNCVVRKQVVRSFWNDVQCCRTEDTYSTRRRDCHRALQPHLSLRRRRLCCTLRFKYCATARRKRLVTPELVEQSIRKQKGSQSIIQMATLCAWKIRPTEVEERATSKTFSMRLQKFPKQRIVERTSMVHVSSTHQLQQKLPDRMTRITILFLLLVERARGACWFVLVGSQDFIDQAHRWRKMFGGGMRQSGILAAAGIYALENNVERMEDDHRRAKTIAQAIDEMDHVSVDLDAVQTNMVYFSASKYSANEVSQRMAEAGIDMFDISPTHCRIVTHLHITDEDVNKVIEVLSNLN